MLSSLNSGKFGRIVDSVEFNNTNIISEDNISLCFKYPDGTIIQDPTNLYRQYNGYLKQFTVPYTLGQGHIYNPRKLSLDLYGTVDLYLLLLELNNMASVMDFNKRKIVVFSPNKLGILMNLVESNTNRYKDSRKKCDE